MTKPLPFGGRWGAEQDAPGVWKCARYTETDGQLFRHTEERVIRNERYGVSHKTFALCQARADQMNEEEGR